MTRRHVALALGIGARAIIAIGLVCSALIVLSALTGCTITPARYEWYPADAPRMDYYRWEVVERGASMNLLCGKAPPDRDRACVIRLREAIVKPGDVRLDDGRVATERGTGSVCLVLSSVDEESAKRLMDEAWEQSLRDHEVEAHCKRGLNHSVYEGRK